MARFARSVHTASTVHVFALLGFLSDNIAPNSTLALDAKAIGAIHWIWCAAGYFKRIVDARSYKLQKAHSEPN